MQVKPLIRAKKRERNWIYLSHFFLSKDAYTATQFFFFRDCEQIFAYILHASTLVGRNFMMYIPGLNWAHTSSWMRRRLSKNTAKVLMQVYHISVVSHFFFFFSNLHRVSLTSRRNRMIKNGSAKRSPKLSYRTYNLKWIDILPSVYTYVIRLFSLFQFRARYRREARKW